MHVFHRVCANLHHLPLAGVRLAVVPETDKHTIASISTQTKPKSSIIKPQIPTTSNSTHTVFGPTPAHIRAHALPSSNPRSYCRDASPCKPLRASAASLPNLVILLQRRPQFKNGGFVLKILTSLA